jgi:hypothetical protein
MLGLVYAWDWLTWMEFEAWKMIPVLVVNRVTLCCCCAYNATCLDCLEAMGCWASVIALRPERKSQTSAFASALPFAQGPLPGNAASPALVE